MKHDFLIYQAESATLIASFSGALAEVASSPAQKPQDVEKKLQDSLANALATMSSSLANAISGVGTQGRFGENAEKFRLQLRQKVSTFIGRKSP